MKTTRRIKPLGLLAIVLSLGLIAGACGNDESTDQEETTPSPTAAETAQPGEEPSEPAATEPGEEPSEPAATEPGEEPSEPAATEPAEEPSEPAETETAATEPAEAPVVSTEGLQLAYLSASSANTWYASSRAQMRRIADENGIDMIEFDAAFNPQAQTAQLQDVIASGEYDGVIVAAVNGPGLIPDIEDALAEGIEVVVLNTVVGDDLAEGAPQVDGIAASSLAPPVENGERMGGLTVQACGSLDPCRVVYLYGIKGFPLDVALKEGFDNVLARNPSVTIVADGEGQYLGPEGGINAMQDILIAAPEFDVVIGADQSIQGVEIVLNDEGMTDVKLIGLGGSITGLQAVAEGRWYGVIYGAPGSEGANAMNAMILALTEGVHSGGINPLADVTDNGLVTAANVDKFNGQWDG